MSYFYSIHWTLDYEPADIKTIKKIIDTHSPFRPSIKIDNWGFTDTLTLGDAPMILDSKNRWIWLLIEDRLYRLDLIHMEPVHSNRYGVQIFNHIDFGEQRFIMVKEKIGIDFKAGVASEKQYAKVLGQNIKLAYNLGLI